MSASEPSFDISAPLDQGRWSGYGKSVAVMMALAIVFDGMNSQMLGLAAPSISAEFHVAKSAFAQVVGAGMAGMAIGAIFGGVLGDRIGRRWAALTSIFVFGAATIAMAAAPDMLSLMALRFAVGLGLGALLPNSAALTAEFTPLRARSAAVMATMACTPVGGILAAVIAASQMRTTGWRLLFVVAGAGALCLAAGLIFLLPESPRYLVQHPQLRPRLARLLSRLAIEAPQGANFTDSRQMRREAKPDLIFRAPYRNDTLTLCAASFFAGLASYSFLSWLPSALSQLGLSYAMQGMATAIFNLGGIVGILAGAIAVSRIGSRRPMLVLSGASVAAAVVLIQARAIVDFSPWALTLCLALLAAALGVVQTALLSLAVQIFPPVVRTTGAGVAGAVGRGGALASSFTAALALDHGGTGAFFLSIAFVMAICGMCLALIERHTPAADPGK